MNECTCNSKKHAIYGKIELGNGQISSWLMFIDGCLSLDAAKAEAIRIKCAWWKGCVRRCWTVPDPTAAR